MQTALQLKSLGLQYLAHSFLLLLNTEMMSCLQLFARLFLLVLKLEIM